MRTMISLDNMKDKINVHEHIITVQMWEFYLEEPDENGVSFGYVMGDENELGYIPIEQIEGFIVSRMKVDATTELMPAAGYEWEEL